MPSSFINSSFLGFKVNKAFKILINTSNRVEYIELDIQSTNTSRTDNPII